MAARRFRLLPSTASVLVLLLVVLLHVAPLSARPGLKVDSPEKQEDGIRKGVGRGEEEGGIASGGEAAADAALAGKATAATTTLDAAAAAPAVPPPVLAPLAKTWVSGSGHRFSLDEAFEAVFEADYEGGKVTVSLGGRVRCGASFNPRSVAACSYDADAAYEPNLIALKSSGLIGLAVAARPEVGARVVVQSSEESSEGSTASTATIDFVCDPGMRRAKGEWTVVGTRKPGGQYFVSVKSAYGCPIRIVAMTSAGGTGRAAAAAAAATAAAAAGSAGKAKSATTKAGAAAAQNQAATSQTQQRPHRRRRPLPAKPVINLSEGIIEWMGTQGYGWRYELKGLAKAVFEFDAPHDVGFLEASIGDAVHCGDSETPDNVLSCLYPDGQEPIVVGVKSAMTIWRASEKGVELKFKQKGTCNGVGTDRATWIRLICNHSVQKWSSEPVYPYEREDCLFIIEVQSALACPVLLGQKPLDKPAVVISKKKYPKQLEKKRRKATTKKTGAGAGADADAGAGAGAGADGGDGVEKEDVGQGCIDGDCQNGVGTFRWPSGTAYSGEWVNSLREGKGNQVWYDGRKYSGSWVGGERHGKGTHTYSGGDRYEGDWVKDLKEGDGNYFWADGPFYIGQFKADQLSGQGTKHWPEHSTRYDGAWAHGQQNGYGTLNYRDGDKWTGEWKGGKKTADGKLRCTKIQFKFNGHCHKVCPTGTFPSQRQCVLCERGCSSCTGTGSEACTKCLPNFALNKGKCNVVHDDL